MSLRALESGYGDVLADNYKPAFGIATIGGLARRSLGHGALFALSFSALALLGGCQVDERSLFIVQNQVPGDDCVTPGDEGGISRSRGVLDVTTGNGYDLFPLIKSDLVSTVALDNQPERNRISLTEFRVKLDLGASGEGADIPEALTHFSVRTSGTLTPGQQRGGFVDDIIPEVLVPLLNARALPEAIVTAHIWPVAEHNGGELEGTEFVFPVELCSGCLVVPLGECPTDREEACGEPQDQTTACCDHPQRGLVCFKPDTAAAGG